MSTTRTLCIISMLAFLSLVLGGCTTTTPPAGPGAKDNPLYDSDRNAVLKDRDGDGVPDQTESIAGTDPENASDTPRGRSEKAFKALISQKTPRSPTQGVCQRGYAQYGPLCIMENSMASDSFRYDEAANLCRIVGGHYKFANPRVATYEDLFHIYNWYPADAFRYNPKNKWIGNMVGDNKVLCGNRHVTIPNDPDRFDFERTCNKSDRRSFWCAYDAY